MSNVESSGTEDDVLYNNWRFGDFAYHLPVYPGLYTVELQFADTYNSAPGQRIFNVVDRRGDRCFRTSTSSRRPASTQCWCSTFEVNVSDGMLDIAFSNGSIGNARLDALRVIRAGSAGDSIFADGFDE